MPTSDGTEANGRARLRDLEQRCQDCRQGITDHMAGSKEKWKNQQQTNERVEKYFEVLWKKMEGMELKITAIEKKVATWSGAAAMIGTLLGWGINYLIKHI